MYFINPMWFYLYGICQEVKDLSTIFGCVFFAIIIAIMIYNIIENNTIYDKFEKIIKKMINIFIICLVLSIFTPSKETCIQMIVASMMTHENINYTKENVEELIDYIVETIGDKYGVK